MLNFACLKKEKVRIEKFRTFFSFKVYFLGKFRDCALNRIDRLKNDQRQTYFGTCLFIRANQQFLKYVCFFSLLNKIVYYVTMSIPNKTLYSLAQTILTENSHPGKLRSACYELYDFFCEIAEFDDSEEDPNIQNGTILSSGKAISPVNAARCLWDFQRTSQFLRGVLAAIIELKKRFSNDQIEIVYAGCGPFAPLITLLLSKFSPEELNLTLLDYHQYSITTVKKIFQKLDYDKFNAEFIQTDATTYLHPRKLHLVVSETMQNSLVNETQTAITLNLAPQLCENGVFVPQSIYVELCLANFGKEFGERERINIGKILELDAEKNRQKPETRFLPVLLEIPIEAKNKDLQMMLLTKIQIFDSFKLDDYDSAISYPKLLRPNPNIENETQIEFSYILDKNPHFEYKIR